MSPVEKACWTGAPVLFFLAVTCRERPWLCFTIVAFGVLYLCLGLYARYCRRRDERQQKQDSFLVMCVTPRDQSRGLYWSGPYLSEEDAKEEVKESQRFIGLRDSLYVVKSEPPKS